MNKKILIDPSVKEKCPSLVLGCLSCQVKWAANSDLLNAEIEQKCAVLSTTLETGDINKIPAIAASRIGYKALGKDPSRYRLSAEALLRRVVKGKGLYTINTIVDTLNLISIDTGYSIGGYDLAKIEGDIVLGIGAENEPYSGIGKGTLNIVNLPVFRDDKGAFGSPTSDSTRTMVTENISNFLMLFFDFGGDENLQKTLDNTIPLYQKFVAATDFETTIIY